MKPLTRFARAGAPGPPRTATTSFTRTDSGAVVCRVTGDVDIESAPATCQELLAALDHGQPPPELFVDLADVWFFGAAGLTALLTLREAAATQRVSLVLVAPSPMVCRVLELTRTEPLFTVIPRLRSAPDAG